MQQDWSKKVVYSFPLFSVIPRVLKKIPDGPSENNDFSCTNMTEIALVPRAAKVVKTFGISDFLEEKSFEKPVRSGSY